MLIVGAMSVIRWVVRKRGGPINRLAALALANQIARMIWAVTTKQKDIRMT